MQTNSIIPSDLHVDLIEGKPMVSSLTVALNFGKDHKNVSRDIRRLLQDEPEFSRLNFEPRDYTDARGKQQTAYDMTEQGFTLLAMGFTGALARQFKIAYINEFVRMRNEINALREELHKKEVELARNKALWDNRITAVMVNENPQKAVNLVIMGANTVAQCLAIPLTQRQAFGRVVQQLDKYFKLK
jgi:Rha family phage regulatory protein